MPTRTLPDFQGFVRNDDPRVQPPNTSIRNLQLEGGSPQAYASLGSQTAGNVAQSTPSAQFSQALMDLMKQYQQLGTRSFQEQGLNAQEEQNRRISAQTPADLIGASPGLQSSVRGASAGALEPTISGARSAQQTYSEQIRSFGDALKTTRDLIKDYEATENAKRDDARATINNALTLVGSGAFNGADPAEIAQLEKIAGYPKGYIQGISNTIKERELELKKQNQYAPGAIGEYQFAVANGYKGSFTQYQNEDANRKARATGIGGLTAAQINQTVNQIAGNFDNEQVVKDFNQISQGYNFTKSLSNTTTNPADDQALIYSLAKALDPGSVVREGEYATAQKYAQSWIKAYGKGVTQAINGTGFLSQEARENIKKTIESKYNISKIAYNNLQKEYQRQINDARAGLPRQITNYGAAFPSPPPSSSPGNKYKPGSVIKSNNLLYLVGSDGKTITLIGSTK